MIQRSIFRRLYLRSVVSACLLSAQNGVALAQATQQTAALEEITVTAQRRAEKLQDVPIAITAFTAEQLSAQGIDSVWDMPTATPGLVVSANLRTAQIFIRGVGSDDISIASDGSTAVYLDGVYLGRPEMDLAEFNDIERIEVLRGPQGTLFGRNAIAGAISIVSRVPDDAMRSEADLRVGKYSQLRFRGSLSGPLVEGRAAGGLAVLWSQRDGYVENNLHEEVPGAREYFQDEDVQSVRGTLRLTPSDPLEVIFSGDYTRSDDFGQVNISVDPPEWFIEAGATPITNPYSIYQDTPAFHKLENFGGAMTVNYDFGGFALKSITAYRGMDEKLLFDSDGTEAFGAYIDVVRNQDQISQEFQLLSQSEGSLSWVAGLFYFGEEAEQTFDLNLPPDVLLPLPSQNETDAYAVYAQADYALSDKWTGTLGLRYSDEKKSGRNAGGPVTDSWSSLTPKLGLKYQPRDEVMMYGSITKGFKSGGFQSIGAQPEAFDPEELIAYEVGTKMRWRDDTLQLNGAAFYYDYSDLQVQTVDSETLTARIDNAAEATVYGVELELIAQPVPALVLQASVALLSAEYDEFIGVDPDTGDPVDLSGNSLRSAPDLSYNLSASYEIGLSQGSSITLMGNVSWQDDVYYSQFNKPSIGQEAYALANARVAWISASGRTEVAAFARNLFDEEYYDSAIEFGFGPLMHVAPPRMYGLEIRVSY